MCLTFDLCYVSEMHGDPDQEGVPCTFEIIHFIGWKPDPSQKQAAKRGSGQVSMKDLDKLDVISQQIDKLKTEPSSDGRIQGSVDELAITLEKLRLKTMELNNDENSGDDDDNTKK